MKNLLLLITLLFAVSSLSFAQTSETKTPVVTKRQQNQRKRIRQGVRSGEIKAGEAAAIHEAEKDVREEKREAKADGVVTNEERKEIQKEQNQASRRIYRTKHNRRDRH